MKRLNTTLVLTLLTIVSIYAQDRVEPIKWGNMEHWTVRYIKESSLIGGKTKTLYILGPSDTIRTNKNTAYRPMGRTQWGISNAYANVAGIAKGACTTQPEKRGNGMCARLDTRIETVKVIGMINIKVCIAGTLFLGETIEPVRSASDPYGKIDMGIPFTKRPKALQLDLKAKVSDSRKVIKALGTSESVIDGHDEPEVYVYLQKRWEDEEGHIFAKRVGTARVRFDKSIPDWKNGYRIPIHYGDITSRPDFKKYQGLFPDGGQFKARNSKGSMVPITEVGWADEDEQPTHVILMVTAGCYPAFYGTPGNALWVDNIAWVY